MGEKRPFSDVDDGAGPRFNGNQKRTRPNRTTKSKGKEDSMSWVRTRARNIERLLQKNQDLPANVQNDLERELAAHKVSIADKAFQRKRSAMISKYHMVRFFGTASHKDFRKNIVKHANTEVYRTEKGFTLS